MEKFFSTLITLVAVFYLLSFVMRIFAPRLLAWLFRKQMSKMADRFAAAQDGETKDENPTRHSGDGLKPHVRKGQSVSDVLGGEYVDYEEVK